MDWKCGSHICSITFHASQKIWAIMVLILSTLTLVCIFSILFSLHFLRCWQGEFVQQARTSLVRDHFLCSCDHDVWFGGDIVRKMEVLVPPNGQRINWHKSENLHHWMNLNQYNKWKVYKNHCKLARIFHCEITLLQYLCQLFKALSKQFKISSAKSLHKSPQMKQVFVQLSKIIFEAKICRKWEWRY